MSRPTHLLRQEHRVIEQAMRALEGICLRMRSGESVPDEQLSRLLDFICNYADRYHHEKEETHLFPALEELGAGDEKGPIAFLRNEHEKERKLLAELVLAVEEYRYDSGAGEKFVSAALRFRDHLIGHMQQEDAVLFRLVEEVLDDDVKDSITRALNDESATIQEMIQHYEKLAGELEKAWSM